LNPRGDGPFQVPEKINDNAYKLDLPSEYGNISATFNVVDLYSFDAGNISESRTNPSEEGENDRDATNPSRDPLNGIGGPMNKSKSKRMNQALQGLIIKINEKEIQHASVVAPNWVTFLQLDQDALSPT